MNWVRLIAYFIVQLVRGAIGVALLALRPSLKLRPAIIAYPLTLTRDGQITLLANLITLTPGTLSIDVSPDKRTLYVHVLDLAEREAFVGRTAAGFETLVLRALP